MASLAGPIHPILVGRFISPLPDNSVSSVQAAKLGQPESRTCSSSSQNLTVAYISPCPNVPGRQLIDVPGRQLIDVPGRQCIDVPGRQCIDVPGRQCIDVSRRQCIDVSRRQHITVSRRQHITVSRRQHITVSRRQPRVPRRAVSQE